MTEEDEITFLQFDDRGAGICAVFARPYPEIDQNLDGSTTWRRELVLVRSELEIRVKNLKKYGADSSVSQNALAMWPE